MDRIRQKSSGNYTLTVPTPNDDGVLVTAAAPATVTVVDGAGASVYTGAATPSTGLLTATVAVASLPLLDTYTCTWASATGEWTSRVEICGGFLFELADLRALESTYADAGRYPASRLRTARTAAEMRFEEAAGVPRCRRVTLTGDGTWRLNLPDPAVRSVRSITVAGVALTSAELAALVVREWGGVDLTASVWTDQAEIVVCYEHGQDYAPAPVAQAVMILAQEYLTRKALAARATQEVTELGTFNLSVAGMRKPTGIPEVDRVAQDFGRSPRLVG
jgi:hypothetical protein